MRIIRPVLAMLLLLVVAGLSPHPAYAHNSTIKGLVNLTPEAPAPGQSVRLQVDMLDVYNADLPGARIRAAFAPDGKPWSWSVTLKEDPVGVYTGDVRTPEAGQAVLLFEATLPDGKWFGELYVRVGPGGRPVFQEPVDFIHEDQLKQQAAASPPAPVPAPAPTAPPSPPPTSGPAPQPAAPQPGPETASPRPETKPTLPETAPAGPATAVTQPPGPTTAPQPAGPKSEPSTAQPQPVPPVSAAQLSQTLARASKTSPVPWVLTGAAVLGIGLLLWYRRGARNSPR